jgi:hypothetical protein
VAVLAAELARINALGHEWRIRARTDVRSHSCATTLTICVESDVLHPVPLFVFLFPGHALVAVQRDVDGCPSDWNDHRTLPSEFVPFVPIVPEGRLQRHEAVGLIGVG